MPEEKKNITCPSCGKDIAKEKVIECEGHCPECEYDIGFHNRMSRYEEVTKKSKLEPEAKPKVERKKYFGI